MSQPCGHAGCRCTVDSDAVSETFCSDVCAEQAGHAGHDHGPGGCPCGHPACADSQ